jgi:hypothetical protein
MRIALITIAVVLTTSSLCVADADVDGKWHGHIETPAGRVPVGFVFKTDGSSLSGSTTGIDGTNLPLKKGKIENRVVSFTVDVEIGGIPGELAYRGLVFADRIEFRATFMGEALDFTVRKVKKYPNPRPQSTRRPTHRPPKNLYSSAAAGCDDAGWVRLRASSNPSSTFNRDLAAPDGAYAASVNATARRAPVPHSIPLRREIEIRYAAWSGTRHEPGPGNRVIGFRGSAYRS